MLTSLIQLMSTPSDKSVLTCTKSLPETTANHSCSYTAVPSTAPPSAAPSGACLASSASVLAACFDSFRDFFLRRVFFSCSPPLLLGTDGLEGPSSTGSAIEDIPFWSSAGCSAILLKVVGLKSFCFCSTIINQVNYDLVQQENVNFQLSSSFIVLHFSVQKFIT